MKARIFGRDFCFGMADTGFRMLATWCWIKRGVMGIIFCLNDDFCDFVMDYDFYYCLLFN